MAQIGSPSAGWYTDPSGQHRARFWDGASWTEQVRDDLTEPASDAAATSSSGGPPANPMADTVAGVAEAVAAVAAADVATGPTPPEPPLVVDYGTDAQWETSIGTNGTGPTPVTDPFAPVMQLVPDAAPLAVEASAVAPAPVPSGPALGWYPDPAARHQARLWDGTRWTERVADHGVESIDPLPGMAAVETSTASASAGTVVPAVDPNAGGWSMDPDGTAAPPTGADGAAMSAGQASLATLPAVDEPDVAPERTRARPTAKVRVAGGMVLGGAIALLVGSALTWMEVTGPRVGDHWTATGVDLGDGRITIALAAVLAVLGAAIITGRMARFGGTKVAAMGALVAGAAATAVTAVDIADVADRASRLGVPVGAVTNVGSGLWLAFVGALFAVGGGLMAFANRT